MSRKHRSAKPSDDQPHWEKILCTSGYGHNTRKPFVHIHFDPSAIKRIQEDHYQLDPNEARDLASNLLQAAEAAENDQFIFEFHANLGQERDEKMGAGVLMAFRSYRDEHGQNK